MPKSGAARTARPTSGTADRAWAEAVRREAVIRPLTERRHCSRGALDQAAYRLNHYRTVFHEAMQRAGLEVSGGCR